MASDTVSQAIDSGKSSCIAFLDLHKAFDSLDHTLLLQRLNNLGVWGKEMTWFSSYLSDRKQCVKCGGIFSEWNTINGGIPQGSTLGPQLFLIMNDIPSMGNCYNMLMTQLLSVQILVLRRSIDA